MEIKIFDFGGGKLILAFVLSQTFKALRTGFIPENGMMVSNNQMGCPNIPQFQWFQVLHLIFFPLMLKLAIKWGFPFSDNFTYFISTMVAYMYPLCPMVPLKLILHFVVSIALVAITVVIKNYSVIYCHYSYHYHCCYYRDHYY